MSDIWFLSSRSSLSAKGSKKHISCVIHPLIGFYTTLLCCQHPPKPPNSKNNDVHFRKSFVGSQRRTLCYTLHGSIFLKVHLTSVSPVLLPAIACTVLSLFCQICPWPQPLAPNHSLHSFCSPLFSLHLFSYLSNLTSDFFSICIPVPVEQRMLLGNMEGEGRDRK